MLSEYISMEIDLEILDMLISDAVTVDFGQLLQVRTMMVLVLLNQIGVLQHSMEQDMNGIKLYWVKSKRFLTKSKD